MSRKKVYSCFGPVLGVALLALLATSCGAGGIGSPTAPSSRSGYAGEWSGISVQGGSIAFTVSNDQKVTAITIGYTLNGCPVSRTFSGLSVQIGPMNDPLLLPSFDYGNSAVLMQTNVIAVQGTFTPAGTASGLTEFFDYMGCGRGSFVWSARKR